jgi:hypothetical protein
VVDFDIKERKEKILELQQYAKYANSCMHAIMLTSIIYQQIYQETEQNEYESFYFNTQSDPTSVTKIMHILSFANNIIEAKEQIKNFWLICYEPLANFDCSLSINVKNTWSEKDSIKYHLVSAKLLTRK